MRSAQARRALFASRPTPREWRPLGPADYLRGQPGRPFLFCLARPPLFDVLPLLDRRRADFALNQVVRRAADGGTERGMEARRMMPPEMPDAERDRLRDQRGRRTGGVYGADDVPGLAGSRDEDAIKGGLRLLTSWFLGLY